MARSKGAGDELDNRTQQAFDAAKSLFRKLGSRLSACDGTVDFVGDLRQAGCLLDDFAQQAEIDDRFASAQFRRTGGLFREGANRMNVAVKSTDPALGFDPYMLAEPFNDLGKAFLLLARSADDAVNPEQQEQTAAIRKAIQPRRAAGCGRRTEGRRPFPDDNPWNRDVSSAPAEANSDALIRSCGVRNLHPGFGEVMRMNGLIIGN